jgi:hypothetical protein
MLNNKFQGEKMFEKEDIEEIKRVLGENLVTLAEYNNGDETRCLAICNTLDVKILNDIKKVDMIPMVFTKNEIKNAVDVFPVELLNIKKHHKMLYGEDILKDIEISKEKLRHQLEFEFRSKLIHLRQAYIKSDGEDLGDLILNAVPTLAPIIGALMYIKGVETKYDPDLVKVMIGIDTKVVMDIHKIRIGKAKFEGDKNKYIERLIDVLTQVGDIVDKMEIKSTTPP